MNAVSQNLAHPFTEMESFLLFVNEDVLRNVQRFTNCKAADIRHSAPHRYSWIADFNLDDIFLLCLGIFLSARVDRDNFTSLDDLWNPVDSCPFYQVVMSCQRFKFFLQAVRFGNFRSRATRLPQDKLAAVSELWQQFVSNFRRFYVPNVVITIDEQLVGHHGSIPGRTYIPTKSHKYGIKIFWAWEAKSDFALNGQIYTGKQGNEVHRNLWS